MELSIGILVIGSLYWNNEGGRPIWREKRLDPNRRYCCKVPIRYGRLSQRRTYTMVFCQLPENQLGQAVAIQCRFSVTSVCDLITEAEWLWAAEEKVATELLDARRRGSATQLRVSSTWGCVALLANPSHDVSQELLDGWAEHVSYRYKANVGRLVNGRGLLEITWPTIVGSAESVPLDLLLATSNNPAPEFPRPEDVAAAWNAHPGTNEYFLMNRESGIQTFQDEEIQRRLRQER